MATIGTNKYTLADWYKNLDPQGKQAKIIEMLMQRNAMIEDIPFVEGNLPDGHEITARAGLPDVFFRSVNKGIPSSKTREIQFTEQCAILEARQEVDVKLANKNGNAAAYRASKHPAFIEALGQKFASTLVYGNAGVNADQFTGFMPRMSSTTAGNGSNIILGGGSGGDCASALLVVWGEGMVTGIVPKGSVAGITHQDLGEIDAFDADGNRYRAYSDLWNWNVGLAVEDWRYMVRLANIDVSDLVSRTNAVDLSDRCSDMIWKLPNGAQSLNSGKPVFYMNRTLISAFEKQDRDDVISGAGLTFDNVDGVQKISFRGIPVKIVDAMLENETVVA